MNFVRELHELKTGNRKQEEHQTRITQNKEQFIRTGSQRAQRKTKKATKKNINWICLRHKGKNM